jgi:hypothetical protein
VELTPNHFFAAGLIAFCKTAGVHSAITGFLPLSSLFTMICTGGVCKACARSDFWKGYQYFARLFPLHPSGDGLAARLGHPGATENIMAMLSLECVSTWSSASDE